MNYLRPVKGSRLNKERSQAVHNLPAVSCKNLASTVIQHKAEKFPRCSAMQD